MKNPKHELLWKILSDSPNGYSFEILIEKLGNCGPATFYRALAELRRQGFEVPCDRKNKYSLSKADFELAAAKQGMGLEESAALLLLSDRLTREKSTAKVKATNQFGEIPRRFKSLSEALAPSLKAKVSWLSHRGRSADPQIFAGVLDALSTNYKVEINHTRAKNDTMVRKISPIRILSYRDVWYMDAYCHERNALRSFALDRIESIQVLKEKKSIPASKDEMNAHFASSYGIFSGTSSDTATLRFKGKSVEYVSRETWHPKQVGKMVGEEWELSFPISDSHQELVGDILAFGSQVEVIAPESLRKEIKAELQKASKLY